MKKKMTTLLGALSLSLALLAGCGNPSAEKIVDAAFDFEMTSATIEVNQNYEVSIKIMGDSSSMDLSSTTRFEISGIGDEEITVHMEDEREASTGDIDIDVENEEYILINQDDEEMTVYLSYDDEWYYYETDDLEEEGIPDSKSLDKILTATKELMYNAEVGKKLEEVNGEKCYVLTLKLNGEDTVSFMSSVAKATGSEDLFEEICEETDYLLDLELEELIDNLGAEIVFYISKENGYLVRFEMDMSDFDFEAFAEELDIDLDDYEIEKVKIKTILYSVDILNINDTEVKIPKSVKNDAEEYYNFNSPVIGPGAYSLDVVEPNPQPKDTSEKYNVDEGWLSLYDYSETYINTLYVPDGFYIDTDWASDYGTYYYLVDSDDHDFFISNATYSTIRNYVVDGIIPEDGDTFKNYSFTVVGSNQYNYLLVTMYCTSVNYGYDAVNNYLLICPYINTWGDFEYISIEIENDVFNSWSMEQFDSFVAALTGVK